MSVREKLLEREKRARENVSKSSESEKMDKILENQRQCHENREILIKLMAKNILIDKNCSRKQKLTAELKLKFLLEKYREVSQMLLQDYQDGSRKKEITSMSYIGNFYKELKYLIKNSGGISMIPEVVERQFESMAEDYVEKEIQKFSDEEYFGSFVDLHECHQYYNNIRNIQRKDYIEYLRHLKEIPKIAESQKNFWYTTHLEKLVSYFEDYMKQADPLNAENYKRDVEEKIQRELSKQSEETTEEITNLSSFSSWEEMCSLGMETLKAQLKLKGLKCGGTLEERAKRLFDARNVGPAAGSSKKKLERLQWEERLVFYIELLKDVIADTIDNVQRKQARMDAEFSDEEVDAGDADSSDDDDYTDVPFNPKNLPLHADGTPIPYWLYKLNGLKFKFNCEICGNYSYRGPKMFVNHFMEPRHAHGMKCLGIPNTSHFFYITRIEEVLAVYQKLTKDRKQVQWKQEDQEFEDSQGNVVKLKTYMDLKRQGVI